MKYPSRLLLAAFPVLAFASCGGGDRSSAPEPVYRLDHYEGVTALACGHDLFPAETMVQFVSESPAPALGTAPGLFGDEWHCEEKFVARNATRAHALVVWIDGESPNRRGHEDFVESLLPGVGAEEMNDLLERREGWALREVRLQAERIANKLNEIATPYTLVFVILGLEDNYSDKAAAVFYETIRPFFSDSNLYVIGENRHTDRAALLPVQEVHGKDAIAPASGIANVDGTCASLEEHERFLNRNAHARVSLLWEAKHQDRECGGAPDRAPRDRTNFDLSGIDKLADLLRTVP